MTSIYDPPRGTGSAPAAPASPLAWPGPAGPGGPAGPAGFRGRGRPNGPLRRARRSFLAAFYLAVIALASFWGLQSSRNPAAAPGHSASASGSIASRVDPGLVDIVTTLSYQRAQAAGTGMVLTRSGEVLTNNHVIEGATSVKVTDVGNGRTYRASVVGYDRSHDVAVLQLQGAPGLQTVRTGNSASAAAGQKVTAIGNAGGKGGTPSVVTGRIVSVNAPVTASDGMARTTEKLRGLISHNAPIKPGDSGGPLVSSTGQVIGMNTAGSPGFRLSGQTTAFAIPINHALTIARRIEAGASSATVHIGATGFLGVAVRPASRVRAPGGPAGSGVVVTAVFAGSPASRAGLAAGDLIVEAGGRRMRSPLELQATLERHHPGDRVSIGWADRGGQRYSATVVLMTGPAG
ncbi:MAG TPA: trypsin-like peptidase domain-containing protein [Streptosporangiaceae bacterium]|nr:trypsin-like peptidase domain-containing protein [Streptosporangiaceae bacterium]